jgi:hypothetical protein
MVTSTSEKAGEDGKQYVLVKAGDDEAVTPEEGGSNAASVEEEEEEEPAAPVQCPEIVYKVQYKDFSGEIKGTKLLDAPYKLAKPS